MHTPVAGCEEIDFYFLTAPFFAIFIDSIVSVC